MSAKYEVREINIKQDMPSVDEALSRIVNVIATSKRLSYRCVKIVHGYGSSGKGGKIRTAARSLFSKLEKENKIRGFLPGESFSIFDHDTREAIKDYPEIRNDKDLDSYNNGVTIVLL